MPVLLLLLVSIGLSIGISVIALIVRHARRAGAPARIEKDAFCPLERTCAFRRPGCWLAIKGNNLFSVQSALALHNPKPCYWIQGLAGDEKLFIAPPIKGWILVFGSGLPDPSEDVDACFRFVVDLSRKLGQVQFFSVSRVLHYHAWVKADTGKVLRAYVWAGQTLWQQGRPTQAENDLDLKCFEYAEAVEPASLGGRDVICANVDKVPLLAARWSLDPAGIEERFLEREPGISGEPSRRY
jgi:hypothetical protein